MSETDSNPSISHRDQLFPRPYAEGMREYVDRGWRGVLPADIPDYLGKRKIGSVPSGYTGGHGQWPTDEQRRDWLERYGECSLALRLPEDVVGVDVDAYGAKLGGETLAKLETEVGQLPATWLSTSRRERGGDVVSGIRFFRVDGAASLRWYDQPGIEIIRWGHRWARVWPSRHVRTRERYEWYRPDGTRADRPPRPDELPILPPPWIKALTTRPVGAETAGNGRSLLRGDDAAALASATSYRALMEAYVASAGNGIARHDCGFDLACQLRDNLCDPNDAELYLLAFREQVQSLAERQIPDDEVQRWLDDAYSRPARTSLPGFDPLARVARSLRGLAGAASSGVDSGSSWQPRDLTATLQGLRSGSIVRPKPSLLCGDDVGCLFYEHKINALWGPSESMKSWIALTAVRVELEAANDVVFIDLEDDEITLVSRLLDLGADGDDIGRHFRYIQPESSPTADELVALRALCETASMVVIDSVGEWLAVADALPNSSSDGGDTRYAAWVRRYVKPLLGTDDADDGPAIILIDHMPNDSRGLLRPGGSQRKRASITGAAYRVDVVEEPAIGQPGRIKLTVAKDRHGARKTGTVAADAVVEPDPLHPLSGRLSVALRPPRAVVPPERDDLLVALAAVGDDGLDAYQAAVLTLRAEYRRTGAVPQHVRPDHRPHVSLLEHITEEAVSDAARKAAQRRLNHFVEAHLARSEPGSGRVRTRWFITSTGQSSVRGDDEMP